MDMMENVDFTKVGLKMKSLRKELGITQDKIAKDLGSTIAFVSNIENNRTKINLRVLMYYSQLCHVPVDSLLAAGMEDDTEVNQDAVVDKEISRVLNHFNHDEKVKLLKMLKIAKNLK